MRSTNSKNQNTQLPAQVAAVNQLNNFIVKYFDMFSLECNNDTLRQLVSAICGPDPRSGKHSAIEIAGTVDEVTQIISFVRKCQIYLNSIVVDNSRSTRLAAMYDVFEIDLDLTEEVLLIGLGNWIYQDDKYEDADLKYSKKASKSFNKLFNWLTVASEYHDEINSLVKGGLSC